MKIRGHRWAWARSTSAPEPDDVKVGANLGDLGVGDFDGQDGLIRIGAAPDDHKEYFTWNEADQTWDGDRVYVVLSALDAWAVTWDRTPSSLLRDKWCRPTGGVSWQIIGAHGQLNEDTTLPSATIHGYAAPGYTDFDVPGQILLQDVLVSYTGHTWDSGTGVSTFTGCTNDPAHDGREFYEQHTGIIPFNAASGGDQGGWGTAVHSLDRVAELWDAGFRLEERLDGFFSGTTDLTAVQFAPWYISSDLDEDLGAAINYPGIFQTADTIPGLLGPGITVTGPAYDLGGYNVPGDHQARSERGFERRTTDWTLWSAADPDGRFLNPILYAKHDVDTKGNGQCYSVNLSLRWVSS